MQQTLKQQYKCNHTAFLDFAGTQQRCKSINWKVLTLRAVLGCKDHSQGALTPNSGLLSACPQGEFSSATEHICWNLYPFLYFWRNDTVAWGIVFLFFPCICINRNLPTISWATPGAGSSPGNIQGQLSTGGAQQYHLTATSPLHFNQFL